jgi:hypothetical protein
MLGMPAIAIVCVAFVRMERVQVAVPDTVRA